MAEQREQMLFRSATAAAEMVRSGQISSRELTELALGKDRRAKSESECGGGTAPRGSFAGGGGR
jgi:hypothetical protein